MTAASLRFSFSIWDLFVVTAAVALMVALPAAAMEILLTAAVLVVELGVLLIVPFWIINSKRAESAEGGERIVSQILLRVFAVAVFVAVFGFAAVACRQPLLG